MLTKTKFLEALLAAVCFVPSSVFAEALSTTSVGMGSRQIKWVPPVDSLNDGVSAAEPIEETLSGPMICHRVSAPSSVFSVEIGASGCMMTGGERNFASSMSGHVMLLYYPFSARMKTTDEDSAVRMKQINFTNIFVSGMAGFSKITRGDPLTPFSYTVDNIDAGLGLGYSYRLFKYVAIGVEAGYIFSSSISPDVATGSSSLVEFLGSVTIFL